jgi:hypothetical protein
MTGTYQKAETFGLRFFCLALPLAFAAIRLPVHFQGLRPLDENQLHDPGRAGWQDQCPRA